MVESEPGSEPGSFDVGSNHSAATYITKTVTIHQSMFSFA